MKCWKKEGLLIGVGNVGLIGIIFLIVCSVLLIILSKCHTVGNNIAFREVPTIITFQSCQMLSSFNKFMPKSFGFNPDRIRNLPPLQSQDYICTDLIAIESRYNYCQVHGFDRDRITMDRKVWVGIQLIEVGKDSKFPLYVIWSQLNHDANLIVHAVHVDQANVNDYKLLEPTIRNSLTNLKNKKCLADSGYAGHKYISRIKCRTGINLISKPKKTSNPNKMSHQISSEDSELLKQRNIIERLFGNLKSFRSLIVWIHYQIMNKYTKKISSYKTHLYLAILCITCYLDSIRIESTLFLINSYSDKVIFIWIKSFPLGHSNYHPDRIILCLIEITFHIFDKKIFKSEKNGNYFWFENS